MLYEVITPFHAHYARDYVNDPEKANKIFDDVVHQFDLIQKHSRDEKTGLLYHGWDESKEQKWANKETGNSQHFWSRITSYNVCYTKLLRSTSAGHKPPADENGHPYR